MRLFSKKSRKKLNNAGIGEEQEYSQTVSDDTGSYFLEEDLEEAGLTKDELTGKTPEEELEIAAHIARYQKKKMITRLVILCVLVVAATAGLILTVWSIKPPDIEPDEGPVLNSPANKVLNTPASSALVSPTPETTPSAAPSMRKEGFYTFIVVCQDDGNGNTDTMILGSYDDVNKKLKLCNIPRDTCANVSWADKKINTLLAFSGIDGLKEGIRDLAGFTVDSYFIVDLEAFTALVDELGGVYFDVPVNMNYFDPTQDLLIDISAGYQWLSGEEALKVVRYRSYVAADIQRIRTQQDFLKALASQTLQLGNILKIKDFAEIFKKHVETDLSMGNLTWYATNFMGLKETDIEFFMLPAEYNDSVRGLSYCMTYVDEWLEMVNENFNPYKVDITTKHVNILTRDDNGNLYATSGSIAGGIDSFYDNTSPDEDYSQFETESSGEAESTGAQDTENEDATEEDESEEASKSEGENSSEETLPEEPESQDSQPEQDVTDTSETDESGESAETPEQPPGG